MEEISMMEKEGMGEIEEVEGGHKWWSGEAEPKHSSFHEASSGGQGHSIIAGILMSFHSGLNRPNIESGRVIFGSSLRVPNRTFLLIGPTGKASLRSSQPAGIDRPSSSAVKGDSDSENELLCLSNDAAAAAVGSERSALIITSASSTSYTDDDSGYGPERYDMP
ncbi:hypothetical protein SAY86_016815 [Trapa natans]|uniref:Uncharacterized protein n=1 Tax=Trapa natans TaxID=22666 RepID=A0AAN7R6V4_TRANT|nr:hypothetical protein SAY86_016815 [Trapa natans]